MDSGLEGTCQTALVLRSVCVGYGHKRVLGPVNLEIPAGRITTLIGPNGAGKSTLLKSITRELPVISGDIQLFGRSLSAYSQREAAQRMAAVLTERVNPELLTCRDIVAVGRYPYTGAFGLLSDVDELKVNQALHDVHAEAIADCDFLQISDGQKQRILLARALCQEPKLLVLDEPTSYLDIKYKLELLSVLQRMTRSRGMTVLMSLHEIDLAQKVSDLVVCVGEQKIIQAGPPETVFRRETIQQLYGMQNGYYDALFSTVEFATPQEMQVQPGQKEDLDKVVVLSMGGTGIPVYRKLQKLGIPFSAGLLSELDADYHLARETAVNTVSVPPFCLPGKEELQEAERMVDRAGYVIDAGCPQEMKAPDALNRLREYARALQKCYSPEDFFQTWESGWKNM